MGLELTILGCGSASPTSTRNHSSQFLKMASRYFLIDCGEGTQIQLRKNKIRMQRIEHVFISHLHGDHYFGLPGLLSSFHLLGREKELHIYCPRGLKEIIHSIFKQSNTYLKYPLHFHLLDFNEKQLLYENKALEIHSIPLKHSIDTCGFLFREKSKPRRINRKATDAYDIPVFAFNKIKDGQDYCMDDGEIIKNKMLTFDPHPSVTYAYCTDTAYFPQLSDHLKDVDLLYHESTFAKDLEGLAKKTKHTTAEQAALIANQASVKKLILGHYSARYNDLNTLLLEAKEVFSETILAEDGMKLVI